MRCCCPRRRLRHCDCNHRGTRMCRCGQRAHSQMWHLHISLRVTLSLEVRGLLLMSEGHDCYCGLVLRTMSKTQLTYGVVEESRASRPARNRSYAHHTGHHQAKSMPILCFSPDSSPESLKKRISPATSTLHKRALRAHHSTSSYHTPDERL